MSPINSPKLLLINPWIYDFSAFNLWSKPLGLLYIASFLRGQGYRLAYFDCLTLNTKPKVKKYGTGHFHRTVVDKPAILAHIPRHFARYGVEEEKLHSFLSSHGDADAVLITSLMTYWYPGVKKTVEIIRSVFPEKPVIVGGVYASILPDHVKNEIEPDHIITGPGEVKVLNLLSKITGFVSDQPQLPSKLDDFPPPAFDLLYQPEFLLIMTSRGCPYNCSFCAQKQISMPFMQRSVEAVIEEFDSHHKQFKVRDFAFYDDALFLNRNTHIKPILEKLINCKIPIRLHAPNGLFARDIDKELAELMYRSQFKTVRLSFETSNEGRRKDMYSKVSNDDMVRAVEQLENAGYKTKDLDSYVMMGLPGQEVEEVIASILFVHNLGVKVRLASFSPIPGTKDFQRAVQRGIIKEDIDPLLTNKSIFPLHQNKKEYETYRKLRSFSQLLNDSVDRGLLLFNDKDIGSTLKKVIGQR